MVDAANAGVFVRAADLGLTGRELPEELDADTEVLERLQAIRQWAAVAMGIARDTNGGCDHRWRADDRVRCATDGCADPDGRDDRRGRGGPDGALPVERPTASGAAADRVAVHRGRGAHAGTLVAEALGPGTDEREAIRIGMPSGILTVGAADDQTGPGAWIAQSGAFFRTTRRLFFFFFFFFFFL